jgi:hypothetical protein
LTIAIGSAKGFPHNFVTQPAPERRVVTTGHTAQNLSYIKELSICAQAEGGIMSEVRTTDEKMPPCPLCTGLTKLKELWEMEDGFHRFFKCTECLVLFPIQTKK